MWLVKFLWSVNLYFKFAISSIWRNKLNSDTDIITTTTTRTHHASVCKLACGKHVNIIVQEHSGTFWFSFLFWFQLWAVWPREVVCPTPRPPSVNVCAQIYSYLWSNVLRMNKWHPSLHSCLISIATSRAFPAELRKNPEWYVKILNTMPIDCSCEFFMKLLNIVILL